MFLVDKKAIRDSGAFLLGELERLDPELHAPLSSVSWGRDIDLREDVALGDEYSSFTNSNFASVGGVNSKGINWVAKTPNAIPGIAVDIEKTTQPIRLWAQQLGFTVQELAAASRTGRSIDDQKFLGLKTKHQMDIDQMVYIGDKDVNATGLCNNPAIEPLTAEKKWSESTPDEILDSINSLIEQTWQRSGFAVMPDRLLVPPLVMSVLTRPMTAAGSMSILQYVREQCLSNSTNGRPLTIAPVKWLGKLGKNGSGRMVAYTKERNFVRFPLIPMQHTPVEYRDLYQLTTYYSGLGEVEFVYPETVGYADGI